MEAKSYNINYGFLEHNGSLREKVRNLVRIQIEAVKKDIGPIQKSLRTKEVHFDVYFRQKEARINSVIYLKYVVWSLHINVTALRQDVKRIKIRSFRKTYFHGNLRTYRNPTESSRV